MVRVSWKAIIVGLLIVAVIARSPQIQAKLKELRLGDMVTEVNDIIWAMPELGRFTCVLLVAALFYITAVVLMLRRNRKGK